MSNVGKLSCRIAQVSLYIYLYKATYKSLLLFFFLYLKLIFWTNSLLSKTLKNIFVANNIFVFSFSWLLQYWWHGCWIFICGLNYCVSPQKFVSLILACDITHYNWNSFENDDRHSYFYFYITFIWFFSVKCHHFQCIKKFRMSLQFY